MTFVYLSMIFEKLDKPQTYFWIYLCWLYSCVRVFPNNPKETNSGLPPICGRSKEEQDKISDSVG